MMEKVEQIIQGLQAGEQFEHSVQEEFEISVKVDDEDGPEACFNVCGSWVTVKLKSVEQAAHLFLGFQGIDHITDVD